MGRSKRRHAKVRVPVTRLTAAEHAKDREIIGKVHQLNQIVAAGDRPPSPLRDEIEKCGGINAYQVASQRGEKKAKYGSFTSAVWVTKQLMAHGLRQKGQRLRLLDVGAVTLQYDTYKSWIDCVAIDLNPQHRCIMKANAVNYTDSPFDVIVLSLVLNFTGDAVERGAILRNCRRLHRDNGYLFIILPLKCLGNSRFFSSHRLEAIVESLGYECVVRHESKKLAFHMFKLVGSDSRIEFDRKVARRGPNLNKFEIVMKNSHI